MGYSPAPGERRTKIIVWDIDDPTKKGDPRYWWDEKQLSRLREFSPDMPDLSGKPKGQSLASLQRRADCGEVELGLPALPDGGQGESVRVSLSRWSDADPERTYLIVSHERRPTGEEQEAIRAQGFPWPPEVEAIRQDWLAALAAEKPDRAAELRRRLDASLKDHGFSKPGELSAWNADKATEIQPRVFVQDERPEATSR